MKFITTEAYNDYLVNKLIRVTLDEYFKNIHEMFYKHIDILFMDYFLSIYEHDDQFIIPPKKLLEYGVLTNIESSSTIQRMLKQYAFKIDIDYQLDNIVQQNNEANCDKKNVSTNSGHNKNIYMLTPKVLNFV